MKYKLPVTITPLGKKEYMARCELVRATATGDSAEEALQNLREAIEAMVAEFGEEAVFRDVDAKSDVRILEVG